MFNFELRVIRFELSVMDFEFVMRLHFRSELTSCVVYFLLLGADCNRQFTDLTSFVIDRGVRSSLRYHTSPVSD